MVHGPKSAGLEQRGDEELVRLAGEGVEEALTCLVHRHAPMVQRLAARFRGPRLHAEDLAQEQTLRAVASWERLRERLKSTLTDLEYRVLMLYLNGYSYEGIAAMLNIGTKAVDNALQRVRRKFSATIWPDFRGK